MPVTSDGVDGPGAYAEAMANEGPMPRGSGVWRCCSSVRRSRCWLQHRAVRIWWWIVLQTRTGSAMLLATLFGVVPQAVVSIFGGSWADRHNRKLLIMLPDMVIAAVTVVLSLGFAMGWAGLATIFVVLLIRSAGGGIQTPAYSRSSRTSCPPANCCASIRYTV